MNSPIESNPSLSSTGKDVYDITFIGAGPVALYGMYYAGLRLMKSKVIDMLGEVGGGPKPFSQADRSRFLSALDAAVMKAKRG